MKTCAVCATPGDEATTCAVCGEASWLESSSSVDGGGDEKPSKSKRSKSEKAEG